MVTKTRSKATCLVPTCVNKPNTRGLCSTCHSAAWRAINAGRVTEEALVDLGLLLLAKVPTPRSKFEAALAKARGVQ